MMGILQALGVYVGEMGHMVNSDKNPESYEHEDLLRYIEGVDVDPFGRLNVVNGLWGFKCPRPHTLDGLKILDQLPQAKFITTHRAKGPHLQSLTKMLGVRQPSWYDNCMRGIEEAIGDRPTIRIWFEDWFNGGATRQLELICDYLDLQLNAAAYDVINPSLKHF